MQNKVSNDLFAAFAKAAPSVVARSAWQRGAQAAGKDLGSKNDRLPVFRVTRPEAERFAQWCGGQLPAAAQLDEAARIAAAARGRPPVVGRWKEGPLSVPDQDREAIQDLFGNGREWTRDEDDLLAGKERVAVLRGASYAAARKAAGVDKPDFRDAETVPTQRPSYASPFTTFRVVIEMPTS
jgi:formylglycine-generating enzyme required for sulfatase activity